MTHTNTRTTSNAAEIKTVTPTAMLTVNPGDKGAEIGGTDETGISMLCIIIILLYDYILVLMVIKIKLTYITATS